MFGNCFPFVPPCSKHMLQVTLNVRGIEMSAVWAYQREAGTCDIICRRDDLDAAWKNNDWTGLTNLGHFGYSDKKS